MIINSVIAQGGIQPSGTKQITTNGTHDVAGYANADVQVPTTAPAHYIEKTVDANGKLINGTNIINLNGVTDIGSNVLFYAYSGLGFPANTNVDLSSLTTISGSSACSYMFQNCTGITSVDLSSLTTLSGQSACRDMFSGCTGITSVDLSSLTTLSGQSACSEMFANCTGITSVDLSGLTTISSFFACGYMFYGCTGLTSVDFSSLTTIGESACGYMFYRCTSLTSLSFPALTSNSFITNRSQFDGLISGVTGCTIHFPSNLDPQSGSTVISSLQGYPNFGGTNTVLAFDLPATE